MVKGDKITVLQPAGEAKECKISRAAPAFCYFSIKDEYRFNTFLECMEKKVCGEWVECHNWDKVFFGEEPAAENSLWTYHRRELSKIIPFLMDEKIVSILYRLALRLMDTEELRRYREYSIGKAAV